MALEAILRVVCGKVDRMESWMTTISFGMSELDLELRNIAHNIDGTSAVDDDAGGKQPWTVPPPDDDIASARAVATVSKKLGKNSKQVRVTGMAAAIIDKLAAEPKGAADKTNKKKKASATPTADTPKKAAKEKKSPSPTQPQSAPLEVDSASSIDVSPGNEAVKANETSGAVQAAVIEPTMSSFINTHVAEEPTASESADEPIEDEPTQAISGETKDDDRRSGRTEAGSVESSNDHQEQAHVDEGAAPKSDSEKSSPHSSPRETRDDVANSGASSADSTPVHFSRVKEQHETDGAREVQAVSDQGQTPALNSRTSTGTTDQSLVTGAALPPPVEATVRRAETVERRENAEDAATTTEQPALAFASQPITPPTLPHTAPPEPKLSPTPSQPAHISTQVATQIVAHDAKAPSTSIPVESAPVPAPSIAADNSQTTGKDPGKRRRSSLLERVLAMNEQAPSDTRRASQESASSDEQPQLSATESREANQSDNTLLKTERQQPEQHESLPATQNPSPSGSSDGASEKDEDDAFGGDNDNRVSEDDDDNSSDPSSNDSDDAEGATEQQQPENKASGSISAATALIGSKRVSIAAGSTISCTMTALKKLKKVNMLTPEEEEELKQRAQDKWFKLKGHVKEKQKKEVANILLKRKKNVFTVSSRLELLEEKSKELFASIKQIGNELKLKTDLTAHESLRRQVADMQRSLQNLDVRLGKLASQLTPEKVTELGKQLDALRSGISEELVSLHHVVDSNYAQLDAQIIEQRDQLQTIEEAIPEQLAAQAQEFEQKLQALPEFGSAVESIRRALRRKADLKMLKEYVCFVASLTATCSHECWNTNWRYMLWCRLEARLLGHTLEEEDCLVRCLSCHKEIINLQQLDKDGEDEESGGGASGNANQLWKVNSGPSSAKIYRSNVPFSAEPTGINSDAAANTEGSPIPAETKNVNATAATRRMDTGLPKASPIRYGHEVEMLSSRCRTEERLSHSDVQPSHDHCDQYAAVTGQTYQRASCRAQKEIRHDYQGSYQQQHYSLPAFEGVGSPTVNRV